MTQQRDSEYYYTPQCGRNPCPFRPFHHSCVGWISKAFCCLQTGKMFCPGWRVGWRRSNS